MSPNAMPRRDCGGSSFNPEASADLVERALPRVPEQQQRLFVSGFARQFIDVGVDMAGSNHDVLPAVVIQIHETRAPL